jgi:hypothetical protein
LNRGIHERRWRSVAYCHHSSLEKTAIVVLRIAQAGSYEEEGGPKDQQAEKVRP